MPNPLERHYKFQGIRNHNSLRSIGTDRETKTQYSSIGYPIFGITSFEYADERFYYPRAFIEVSRTPLEGSQLLEYPHQKFLQTYMNPKMDVYGNVTGLEQNKLYTRYFDDKTGLIFQIKYKIPLFSFKPYAQQSTSQLIGEKSKDLVITRTDYERISGILAERYPKQINWMQLMTSLLEGEIPDPNGDGVIPLTAEILENNPLLDPAQLKKAH